MSFSEDTAKKMAKYLETQAGRKQALAMNKTLGHNVETVTVPTSFTEDTAKKMNV